MFGTMDEKEKKLRKKIANEIANELQIILENVATLGEASHGRYNEKCLVMILNKIKDGK